MFKTIGIIGFGNMGSAFYYGIRESRQDLSFLVYDRHLSKLDRLPNSHRANNIDQLIRNSDYVLLAMKPQSFDEFSRSYRDAFDQQIVISIMAGISIDSIQSKLRVKKMVRCMPNLPVKVKRGVIGWVASNEVTDLNKKFVQDVFSAMGYEIELKEESMIEAITLIAGCGPGYFYYFTEMLAKKAQSLGLDKERAQKLTESTFIGSAELLNAGNLSAAQMKQAVASKGGLTEAALNYWIQNDFTAMMDGAIEAARKRNEELNR